MENTSTRLLDLSEPTRDALEIVAHYFELQLTPQISDMTDGQELEDVLAATRRSLSCLALAAELTPPDQAALLATVADAHLEEGDPSRNAAERLSRASEALIMIGLELARNRLAMVLVDVDRSDGHLSDHECFRRGDLVRVQVADPEHVWRNRLAMFVEYTDPRLGHPQRLAAVHLHGELPTMRVLVSPFELAFHPEEQLEVERYEHLGSWSRDGFRLELYDTGQVDRRDKAILAYELFDEEYGPEPVFSGADFHCSPLEAVDSLATVASLLSFLGLRPGDTDAEYFSEYTLAQLEWCQARAQELSWIAEEYRQLHEWTRGQGQGEAVREDLVAAWLELGHAVPWMQLADPPFAPERFTFCRDLEDLVEHLLAEERHAVGAAFALGDLCCICLSESGEEEWLVIRGRESLGNLPLRVRDEDGELDREGTEREVWRVAIDE